MSHLATYVLLLGNSAVGKSTMAAHLRDHTAPELQQQVTISPEFVALTVPVAANEVPLKLTLIDVPGSSTFETLVNSFYRRAEGIILMYDVTKRETFTALRDGWMPRIRAYGVSLKSIVVVANQCDRPYVVSHNEGKQFAADIGAKGFYAISALKGTFESILTPLSVVLRDIVDQRKAEGVPLPQADATGPRIVLEEARETFTTNSCCK